LAFQGGVRIFTPQLRDMKKILYLHGLESGQGGPKVDFLSKENYVFAPTMDYTRKGLFTEIVQKVEEFDPDVIVGSSMGGYFGYMLAGLFKKKAVLYNPALHSRIFEPNVPSFAKKHIPDDFVVVLGDEDTVIPPNKTLDYLKDHLGQHVVSPKIERVKTMGHRVDLQVFVDMYNKHIK